MIFVIGVLTHTGWLSVPAADVSETVEADLTVILPDSESWTKQATAPVVDTV